VQLVLGANSAFPKQKGNTMLGHLVELSGKEYLVTLEPCGPTTVNEDCWEAQGCMCPEMIGCDVCARFHMSDAPCFLCNICGEIAVEVQGTPCDNHKNVTVRNTEPFLGWDCN
jgi:hypothetical protein